MSVVTLGSSGGLPAPVDDLTSPPLTTWQLTWRYLIGWGFYAIAITGAVVGVFLGGVWSEDIRTTTSWSVVAIDAGLSAMVGILIRWRRRYPVTIAVVLSLLTVPAGASVAFWAWALVSLGTRRRLREAAAGFVASMVAIATSMLWSDAEATVQGEVVDGWPVYALGFGFAALWAAAYLGVGFYVGARRALVASLTARAETAEREQALQVAQARAVERSRIAREMHDVLAHRISLVSMHAGVLAYREDLPPDKTREIAGVIQDNSHAALTELRSVLATLRSDDVEAPQPTVADLDRLIEHCRLGGMTVDCHRDVTGFDELPANLARHLYRAIQEALTNARKHAVGAPVTVRISGGPGVGIALEVRNPLTSDSGVPGSGMGLIGLAERAEMVGGRFEASPHRGDFVVKVWFPWQSRRES